MLKRLMLVFGCISLLTLVACAEENGPAYTVKTDPVPIAFGEVEIELEFSVEMISDEELEELKYDYDVNEIDYAMARDNFITEGINLHFSFSLPVTDFTIIEIAAVFLDAEDEEAGEMTLVKTGVLYEVGDICPDVPFVLTHYFGHGTISASGFYFIGPNGEENWYTLQQSPMDGEIVWQTFDWSLDQGLFVFEEYEPEPEPEPEPYFSIRELGSTIVAAGTFWEDWWTFNGQFSHVAWEEGHLEIYNRLLPASGFTSLDDVHNYLSQYYTGTWVDSELSREFPIFIEHDSRLYINSVRAGFARPDWTTATHVLIEQEGSHALVETTVLEEEWHQASYREMNPWEVRYRFTFIDGRISSVEALPVALSHPIVGSWRFVAAYDIFGNRFENDDNANLDFIRTFNANRTGTNNNHGFTEDFVWNDDNGEITETLSYGHLWIWTYEINGDILRITRILDPEGFIHVQGTDHIEIFKSVQEFIRIN